MPCVVMTVHARHYRTVMQALAQYPTYWYQCSSMQLDLYRWKRLTDAQTRSHAVQSVHKGWTLSAGHYPTLRLASYAMQGLLLWAIHLERDSFCCHWPCGDAHHEVPASALGREPARGLTMPLSHMCALSTGTMHALVF